MPKSTVVEIPPEEQAQMLAALRRARYGYLLALHILLLCATGRNPTDIAAVLFCSRSSVYRTVYAYREVCTTLWGRAKPMGCSGNCCRPWMMLIQSRSTNGSIS
jgi:Homeodomain-like domain